MKGEGFKGLKEYQKVSGLDISLESYKQFLPHRVRGVDYPLRRFIVSCDSGRRRGTIIYASKMLTPVRKCELPAALGLCHMTWGRVII